MSKLLSIQLHSLTSKIYNHYCRGDDYEDRLRLAINEILAGKSQNEIAKKHQIAKTTIWRIMKKITQEEKDRINVEGVTDEIVERLVAISKKRSMNLSSLETSTSEEVSVKSEKK